MQCSDGQCISNRYVCDSLRDCPNGEDEFNCQGEINWLLALQAVIIFVIQNHVILLVEMVIVLPGARCVTVGWTALTTRMHRTVARG